MKSYNKVLLFCITLLFCQEMQGQSVLSRPRRLEMGFVAAPGLSWASLQTKGYQNAGVKLSGMYAFVFDLNLAPTSENYYFSTGIGGRHFTFAYKCKDIYQMTNLGLVPVEIKSKQKNVYLVIPTAFKMKTNYFGRFVIVGSVGLEHAICVWAKSTDEVQALADKSTERIDKVQRYKQTLAFREALLVAAGFEFLIKDNTRVSAALSYNYGFINIFRRSYENQYFSPTTERINAEKVKAFAHCIELQLGFVF